MKDKIMSFVSSIIGTVDKSDAELDLQTSIETIDMALLHYDKAANLSNNGKFHRREVNTLIDEFYKGMNSNRNGVRLSSNHNFCLDMTKILKNLKENAFVISDELARIGSGKIAPAGLTAKDANILRAVPHYYYISKYLIELLNYIVAVETESISKAPTNIPKKQVNNILNGMHTFSRLVAVYGTDPKDFKVILMSLSSSILSEGDNSRVDALIESDGRFDMLPAINNNFVGSPIYMVRQMIAQWQAERYHQLKETNTLLQLRLSHYENLKYRGEVNAEMEKEIEYLQNSISIINADIEKMEASVA